MSWRFDPAFDASHRAALAAGKPLIYVAPPASWVVLPLFTRLAAAPESGLDTLALAPNEAAARELAGDLTSSGHHWAVTPSGLARTGRLLRTDTVATLVSTSADALALVQRSLLKLERLRHIVILWPELHAQDTSLRIIDTLLGEARGAQRSVVTGDAGEISEFLDRHAHRAPVLPASEAPKTPGGTIRYAISGSDHLGGVLRAVLDALDPASTLLWDPHPASGQRWSVYEKDPTVMLAGDVPFATAEVAIATDLPTPEVLTAMRAAATTVVVLARPHQVPYLRHLSSTQKVLSVSPEASLARDRLGEFRRDLRARLLRGSHDPGLLALAPLFDEFDPATVAAALVGQEETAGAAAFPSWVHVRLAVGSKDRIRPGDVVGALINAIGVPKSHVGRVEVRDSHTQVEIRAESADQALQGFRDVLLRGRAVAARVEEK